MFISEIIKDIKKGQSKYIKSEIIEDIKINKPESIENASKNEITFLENNNSLRAFIKNTNASVLIISNDESIFQILKDRKKSIIVVENPKIAFSEVLSLFDKKTSIKFGIDSSAHISENVSIGKDCFIGSHVFIGEKTKIGNNNYIFPGTVILENVNIGNNNIIHPNCVIYKNTLIKDNCIINSNTVIGSEGFGFIPKDGQWIKMPQTGGVILKDFVEIGTNCCIDRPSVGNTVIGEGTKIDNLVQIGHGVQIGKNCAFAAQVGIAGGAIIGDGVILAGQVGVNNRVKVGNNVVASSKCGIHCDIKDGEIVSGFPALPNKSWLKSSTIFKNLPKLAKKLRQLDN